MIDPPPIKRVNLNASSPVFVYSLNLLEEESAISVCASTGTLELFISVANFNYGQQGYFFYDSDDLKNFVYGIGVLNLTDYLINITSKSKCITLFKSHGALETDSVLFYRIKEVHSENCKDDVFLSIGNNTIQLDSDESCEFVVLSNQKMFLQNIHTLETDSSEDIEVYPTGLPERILFTFK